MLRIAFIILAHETADPVVGLARALIDGDPDCQVVIHYDRNSPDAEFRKLQDAANDTPRLYLVAERVSCPWGQFGLVDAVVRAMRYIRVHDLPCDREMLISSSCWPVRPLAQLKRYLAERPEIEFIQCEDESWIVDGLREERYQYRYWFNFKAHKLVFDNAFRLQRSLRLRRRFPAGLVPRFGSQWWCLTRTTCNAILDYIDTNPRVYDFFRAVWIPDEMCIQTLVNHLAPLAAIAGHTLTYAEFSHKGKPLVLYDDHTSYLAGINFFFARKISGEARTLKEALAVRAAEPDDGAPLDRIGLPEAAYGTELARRAASAKPGQVFRGVHLAGQWPGALAGSGRFVVVLFGPGALVRHVSAGLRGAAGLEVLGRIFNHHRVDFGEGRARFHGLCATDTAIRDCDPALYLSRLLERSTALPVIELTPADHLSAILGLLDSDNAIFVPVLPGVPMDGEGERLFFALGYFDRLAQLADQGAVYLSSQDQTDMPPPQVQKEIDALLDSVVQAGVRYGIRDRILQREAADRMLHIELGAFGGEIAYGECHRQEQRMYRSTAGAALPLLNATRQLRKQLAAMSPEQVVASLPSAWARYFLAAFSPLDGVPGPTSAAKPNGRPRGSQRTLFPVDPEPSL